MKTYRRFLFLLLTACVAISGCAASAETSEGSADENMVITADDKQIDLDFDGVTVITLDMPTEKWSISDQKTIQELEKSIEAAPVVSTEYIQMPDGSDGFYYTLAFWDDEEKLQTVEIDDNMFIVWADDFDSGVAYYTEDGYFKTVIEQIQSAGAHSEK